jgi:hypothetical protein
MFKFAFYEKDITPPLGGYLAGQYSAIFAEDVLDKLFVKAFAASDGENTIMLIALDVCVLPHDMYERVTERIKEYTGREPENVALCATHTHKGAPILDSPELNLFADAAYKDVLYRLTADCAILAYKRLGAGTIKYVKGHVDSISFIRNYLMKDGSVRTNPGIRNPDIVKPLKEIDPDLCTLLFFFFLGKPAGAIVNFACHQDCVGGVDAYSGDYSSVLAGELKKAYGHDFVSLFVPGACGDINHFDVTKDTPANRYVEMGKILAQEVQKSVKEAKEIKVNRLSSNREYITINKRPCDDDYFKEKMTFWLEHNNTMCARNLLVYHSTNTEERSGVFVQSIKIGDALIYALPGEVFSWFGHYIKENSPSEFNIIATLSNGNTGYIPVREAFKYPFLYETALCHHSCLDPEAGYIIVDKALELARK